MRKNETNVRFRKTFIVCIVYFNEKTYDQKQKHEVLRASSEQNCYEQGNKC